jgi:ABC-type transporter Mla subunit MlaD
LTGVSLLDPVTGILRGALGAAERVGGAPVHDALQAERDVDRLAEAMHRAADTAERHMDSIDRLASAVPALTDSVNHLTETMNGLLETLRPLQSAERDVSKLGHLFGRHRDEEA